MKIFLAGITGVGKTYFGNRLAKSLGKPYHSISASKIIKDKINIESKYAVLDLDSNLSENIRTVALKEYLEKHNSVIIDGHFTIWYNNTFMTVFYDNLIELFDLYLVLVDSIENITDRRKHRLGMLDTIDENIISKEIEYENKVAQSFLQHKSIQLLVINNAEPIEINLTKVKKIIKTKPNTK